MCLPTEIKLQWLNLPIVTILEPKSIEGLQFQEESFYSKQVNFSEFQLLAQ